MMAPVPLAGRRIAVTRQADQAETFCRRLKELGATPVRFPTIDFAPLSSPPLTHALSELDAYRWIVLTSPNAVRFFLARLQTAGLELQALGRSIGLAATGPTTAAALQAAGATAPFVPQAFTGEALAATLPDVAGKRILIPRTEQGRPSLVAGLTARGAQVDDIAIYRTVIGRPTAAQCADLAQGVDALTFTSPLTVVNFVQLADLSAVRDAVVACIGPSTAEAAEEQGLAPDIVPGEYTTAGLLDSICDYYSMITTAPRHTDTDVSRADLPIRPRRLRHTPGLRRMVRETTLAPTDFIYPLFVTHGRSVRSPIASMPGIAQLSVDEVVEEARAAANFGIAAVLLFGIPAEKDPIGRENFAADGIVQQAIRALKDALPELIVITDVCLCEYTDHGHCGVLHHPGKAPAHPGLEAGYVLNDETLPILAEVAVSHAAAGADIVAPSGMMDGMVAAIRAGLDGAGHQHTPIMSYAVKYASAFYGPFRDAADGAPKFGDRKTHQMDPANVREALREAALDVAEGADFLMVKPALAYLDVIRQVKDRFPELPMAAYNVSGEYAMIKAAVANGWLSEAVILETLLGIKRAGADLIITYHALEAAQALRAQDQA